MTTCVMVWAESEQNRDGDEYRVWRVGTGDDDLEPTGRVYNCSGFDSAIGLARRMAADRRLPIERLD